MITLTENVYVEVSANGKTSMLPLSWYFQNMMFDTKNTEYKVKNEPLFIRYKGKKEVVIIYPKVHYLHVTDDGIGIEKNCSVFLWSLNSPKQSTPARLIRPGVILSGIHGAFPVGKVVFALKDVWETNAPCPLHTLC